MICIQAVKALPTDWVNPSGKQHFIFYVSLKDIYTNDVKDTLVAGGAFAVFGKVQGVEKCLGYNVIDNDLDTLNVRINADDFSTVTNLKIKYWDIYRSCTRTMNYVNTNMVLQDSSSFKLGTLSFYDLAKILYPKDTLLTNESPMLPTVGVANEPITFSGSAGLNIDPATGAINPKLTLAGKYNVYVATNECYIHNDIEVVVKDTVKQDTTDTKPKLDAGLLHFKLVSPTCNTKGSIIFDGSAPLGSLYTLVDVDHQSIRLTSSTGIFTNLKDGIYKAEVGYNGDTLTYGETFALSAAKGCGNPVLNFSNPSGDPPSIYLEKPGVIQIFNRDGKLMITLQAPAEWNGTDQSGREVPMGDYYLYLNDNKEQTITILR